MRCLSGGRCHERRVQQQFHLEKHDWCTLPDDLEWPFSETTALYDGKETHGDVSVVMFESDVQSNSVPELDASVGCLTSIADFTPVDSGRAPSLQEVQVKLRPTPQVLLAHFAKRLVKVLSQTTKDRAYSKRCVNAEERGIMSCSESGLRQAVLNVGWGSSKRETTSDFCWSKSPLRA